MPVAIEQRDPPLHQPGLFDAINAPPTRRLRQIQLAGDIGRRQAGIALQQLQNSEIFFV
jgi:hypothetical protein